MIRPALILVVDALALIACGGGGGGNGGGNDSPQQPPVPATPVVPTELAVDISFPINNAALRGVSALTVSGWLVDQADGELDAGDVANFSVNGVAPVLDTATGRWSADVSFPEQVTPVALTASVTDRNGTTSRTSITLDNRRLIPEPGHVAVVPGVGDVLAVGSGAFLKVSDGGAETTLITGAEGDSVSALPFVRRALRYDTDSQRAYLLGALDRGVDDRVGRTVLEIDTETGEAAAFGETGGRSLGSIPDRGFMDFDVRGELLVYSGTGKDDEASADDLHSTDRCWLTTFDASTSERKDLVAAPIFEQGEAGIVLNFCPGTVVLDIPRQQVITTHEVQSFLSDGSNYPDIYAISLQTGLRTLVSGTDRGEGPPLPQKPGLLIRTSNGEHVIAPFESSVFEIELATGDRRVLMTDPNWPEGFFRFAYDDVNRRFIFISDGGPIGIGSAEFGGRLLSSLDVGSGSTRVIARFSQAVGSGVDLYRGFPLLDGDSDRLLVLGAGSLVEVDLNNLERRNIPTEALPAFGSAPPLFDAGQGWIYLSGTSGNALNIWRLNPAAGQVQAVTGGDFGGGLPIIDLTGMCLDDAAGLLYLTGRYGVPLPFDTRPDVYAVMSVDLATGERAMVSSELQALGAEDTRPDQILCDPQNDRLIITGRWGSIIAVDTDTGDRSLLVPLQPDDELTGLGRAFAWDAKPDQVLMEVLVREDAELRREVRSIDLVAGQAQTVALGIVDWVYDAASEVFYGYEAPSTTAETGAGLRALARGGDQIIVLSRPD